MSQLSPSQEAPGAPATVDRLVETLRTTRLTVVIGAPGSGKTRLLSQGVLWRLRRRTDDLATAVPVAADFLATAPTERRRRTVRPRELVVFCDRWDGSPEARVHDRLDAALGIAFDERSRPRLSVALRAKAVSAERAARLLFVFDHADRPEAESADGRDPAAEYDALVNALCSVSPSVHLLLSAREGALPPSVQSRLGSADTCVVRLPDPGHRDAPGVDAQDADVHVSPASDPGRPLHLDDVYASIADRLGRTGVRAAEAPWGAGSAPVRQPVVAPRPSHDERGARRGTLPGRIEPGADSATGDRGGSAADAPEPAPPQVPDAPSTAAESPPFLPGAFARAAAERRSRGLRRARAAALVVGLGVVAAIGTVRWLDRDGAGPGPEASARQLDARIETKPRAPDPVPEAAAPIAPGDAAPRPGAEGRDPASPAAAGGSDPALAAASAPLPSEDTPVRTASRERAAEAPLADELWQAMSRHGVARLGTRATGDPVDALAAGRRFAVVSYDSLRTLAASRGLARTTRVVAPLFAEEIHVIVRADSNLSFIHEIAGRRVDFGPVQGARHRTAVAFFRRLFDRPPTPAETDTAELDAALAELLAGGAVEAIVLAEPQPSAWLARLPGEQLRRLKLLAVAPDDPSTRRALRSYLPATLRAPAGIAGPPVRSFAVMTFLVANSATPVGRDDTAAAAARALCLALPDLRRGGHPKWREVDPSLQLPVPLAYDPEASSIGRACNAARDASGRPSTIAESDAEHDNPPKGERQ